MKKPIKTASFDGDIVSDDTSELFYEEEYDSEQPGPYSEFPGLTEISESEGETVSLLDELLDELDELLDEGSEEEFEGAPELFEEEFDDEWSGEINRRSPGYIRWVQQSLNKIMGLNLKVDGIMGPATRSAIRSFQQKQGLVVDGIVGPKTEGAIKAAFGAGRISTQAEPPYTTPPILTPPTKQIIQQTVYGWSQYKRRVEELPPDQQAVLRGIGNTIVASYEQGAQPVRTVKVYGHADWDTPRNPQREQQMSKERANQVMTWLKTYVGDSIAAQIIWDARGFGATQLKAPPTTEINRRQNRRVEVSLSIRTSPASIDKQLDEVLRYIQDEARKAAQQPKTVAGSNFAQVVRSRYLHGYLALQSPATANAAISHISRQNRSGFVTNLCGSANCSQPSPQCLRWECDNWECSTPLYNAPLSPLLRKVPGFQWMPLNYGGAATDILRVANRRTLSHIDVPFLLGQHTLNWLDCKTRSKIQEGQDTDLVADDSKNESQLMHWATGVKYSHLGRDRLRELFIGYELWHLEQWDVFGLDPINDLIAEDAGRHMAKEIRSLRMRDINYIRTLDQGFIQARAWVGALVRLRRSELDKQIKAEMPPPWVYRWIVPHPPTEISHPYRLPSIRQMLVSGMSVEDIKASSLVARYIEVYTLIFDADAWEMRFGPVPVSVLQRNMVEGRLNSVFRALAYAEAGQPSSRRSRAAVRYALLPRARFGTRLIRKEAAGLRRRRTV